MDRETKMQLEAMRTQMDEWNEFIKEGLKTRDQVTAIRKALGNLATVLERIPGAEFPSQDLSALRDVCKQLRRL